MASRHQEFLSAGARIVAIDIDSPGRHAAMVEKLALNFPMLSDPDRSLLIGPMGLSNPTDARNIGLPALVLLDSQGEERWRFVSRDYAERLPEDEVLAVVKSKGWSATSQAHPAPGVPEEASGAMPFDGLNFYFRGAKFAAQAMGLRHAHLDESVKVDSKAYVAEMDRFIEAVKAVADRRK